MNNFYWLIAAIIVLIGSFQIYLVFTDQHIHAHYQNTSNEKKPEPTWRNGRAWFSLSYNDDNRSHKYYPSPTLHPWWHLFHRSLLEFKFYLAGDDFDIQFFIGFLFGSVGIQLAGTSFFRWLFKDVYRMGWGYATGVAWDLLGIYRSGLTFYLAYNDMSSGPSFRIKLPKWKWLYDRQRRWVLKRRWDRKIKLLHLQTLRETPYLDIDPFPAGIHLWRSVDYIKGEMPTGGGWYFSIDFDRIIRGSYEREERQIEGTILNVEVPIEPDNALGLHYYGNFTRTEETRWRSHWPWNKKKSTQYWEIEFKNPPMHAGKGENSYDQDDDGIMGCSAFVETLEEAIKDYQERVYRDRKKYGMPDMVDDARRRAGA